MKMNIPKALASTSASSSSGRTSISGLAPQGRQLRRCQHRHVSCKVSEAEAAWATKRLKGIIAEIRADPALSPLLDDPAVVAAVTEVADNPGALSKYANKPKVSFLARSIHWVRACGGLPHNHLQCIREDIIELQLTRNAYLGQESQP
jgi:hypothetical protein